ncbi:MAG: SMC-Scp complex subunit ScpB [Polyangiaceae bacterium]|nr:SMC-Scp complex subunit ScpB [Polyangiaceae bacterium]
MSSCRKSNKLAHALYTATTTKAARTPHKTVAELLRELRTEYENRGIRLVQIGGGFTFRTAPEFGPFVRELSAKSPTKLTRAQLEALAIVAYRQPLTKPEIDDIRGVDTGGVLKLLLERGLIRILGKRDEPGRPLVYGTTPEFLSLFSLKSLKDLPSLREFSELTEDSKRVLAQKIGDEPQ